MKPALLVFLATACLPSILFAVEEKPAPEAAVVLVLKKPLPFEEGEKSKFLWDRLANKSSEHKFDPYTTENWKQIFVAFAAALVKKADARMLDSESLRKVLGLVLRHSKGKIAYLPVGAYQTTLEGRLVWIVAVKWEYPSMSKAGGGVSLGHISAFVFDQQTLKQVGFITCG